MGVRAVIEFSFDSENEIFAGWVKGVVVSQRGKRKA